MNRILSICLLACATLIGVAQSNVRINNYWENPYYINPAAINDAYGVVLSTAVRKQWFGVPGAPGSIFAAGTTYIDKMQTQFGIKFFADEIGYTKISNASLSYAYSVTLNPQWRLHLGLAANFQNFSYDYNQVNAVSIGDVLIDEMIMKSYNYNSDLGVQLKSKSVTVGISSQNILSMFFEENKLQTNSNFLYAIYRNKTNLPIDMQYGISAIQYANLTQMEFNITTFIKSYNGPDLFNIGLFYRTRSEMGVLLGVNLGENLNVSYSYDYNVGGVMNNFLGSHELMLIFKIDKKKHCINCD